MPHQLGPRGSGLVECSSLKWRRKILQLTRQDYEYEQSILPHYRCKPERSNYAIDNSLFVSRFQGKGTERPGRLVDRDNYYEITPRPIQTISRSADGRFVLGDPEMTQNEADSKTLDSSVYPTTHASTSHIHCSHVQGRALDDHDMQSNWDYVQFYHPQYYLKQDKNDELGMPPQRMRYPDVHLAAVETPPIDHVVPTNDDNGFHPTDDQPSGAAYRCRRYGARYSNTSGADNKNTQQISPTSSMNFHNSQQPPTGHKVNEDGIYSRIIELSSETIHPSKEANPRRSMSVDSYCGNYADYPPAQYPSRSRAPHRRPEVHHMRTSLRSAHPSQSPGLQDQTQDHHRDNSHYPQPPPVCNPHPLSKHHYQQSQGRLGGSRSPIHLPGCSARGSRSPIHLPGCSAGFSRFSPTPATPGTAYRSFMTSSPDADDRSDPPFIVSDDISSVLPGSSLMTSSNQLPSSLTTSPSLHVSTEGNSSTPQSGNNCPAEPLFKREYEINLRPSRSDRSGLHHRSLSEGDGLHWRYPWTQLSSGMVEDRVTEYVPSPRTVQLGSKYVADVVERSEMMKAGAPVYDVTQESSESSPEELSYTREKLDRAIKHVREGRLQPSYGHSAPQLNSIGQSTTYSSLNTSLPTTMVSSNSVVCPGGATVAKTQDHLPTKSRDNTASSVNQSAGSKIKHSDGTTSSELQQQLGTLPTLDAPGHLLQDQLGEENYVFDGESELLSTLQGSAAAYTEAGVTMHGAGRDVTPSPDPNESMEDKFNRLRREFKEYQSSQENLDNATNLSDF